MTLTTEVHGDIPDVSSDSIADLLQADAFGEFAILSASATDFLQIGNDWQASPECGAFLGKHDSDPWLLEYRAGTEQFGILGHVTLDQAIAAFQSYLAGGLDWRTGQRWVTLDI